MNNIHKAILNITAGLLFVGLADTALADDEKRKPKRIDFQPIIEQMQLSDEQQTQFESLLKQHHKERKAVAKDAFKEIHKKHKGEMAEVLTPEQLEMFDAYIKKNRPRKGKGKGQRDEEAS